MTTTRRPRWFRHSLLAVCLSVSLSAQAEGFVVREIRLEGLQRLSSASVLASLPVAVGESVDENRLAEAVRALFKTGQFEDVQAGRDGEILVFNLTERPAIASIEIEGNKAITKDDLLKGLKQAGLAEGEVFQRSLLDHVKQELERQYIGQGRYNARIDVKTVAKPRNRVALQIKIKEGKVAAIRSINFVGNKVFADDELLDIFQLKSTHLTSFFKNDDKYSREKLSGDLEALRSYYLDRGYVNFTVNSTQVTVSPELRDVFLDVNLSEGEKYSVGEVKIVGELPVPEEQLRALLLVKKDQVFSQQLVTSTGKLMTRRLGNDGYIFAEVNGVPELNNDKHTADITFYVNPGKQVYVRRISFAGNMKSDDHVLRREMRQFEGALASSEKIDLSKSRLQRLGFFKEVKVDTPRVPGTADLVDMNVSVEEQPSGSIGASIGFSQGAGFMVTANVSQENFMGTGNRVSFAINRSETRDVYSLSYLNPYFTPDGVSRGFNLYYRATKLDSRNVSTYLMDSQGGNVTIGYPIEEIERISLSLGADKTDITLGGLGFDSQAVVQFVRDNGNSYSTFPLTVSWNRSTLNRGMFADRGAQQSVSLEAAVPGSDVTYFKLGYTGQRYFPLTDNWVTRLRTDLGFGSGYGKTDIMPFYKHYFAGGFGSVRGYRDNTLGPRSPWTLSTPDPDPEQIGGNLLVEASAELILPMPFLKDSRSVRPVLFFDAGNVFDSTTGGGPILAEDMTLKMSYGISLAWLTAIGPLSFSLAWPINEEEGDETQRFQFTIGQGF